MRRRCGAGNRSGASCRREALVGRRRCRLHGSAGASPTSAAADSLSAFDMPAQARAGNPFTRVAIIFSTSRCALRIVRSFDSGGKPRFRRPPGKRSISPRAFASRMRSTHARRPSPIATLVLSCA